ncbi:Phosphatidylinositol_3-kinase [Hexamita inflata]|uniref:Putative n=1 Tax=Hexamita inflata TaxID=28002 RepID=A0AA86TPA4_9EUKA|nr:Phosphatidylinositol 3-kinase [Hexamita inflata]CAI9925630.1 Phosphatidylinositol 3-kinase [Hexamita inflata]
MPSIFKKQQAAAPAAPAPLDINEMIQKINRSIVQAKEQETKAYDQAKNAMKANNQVMAKTYMNACKMAQNQQKNLMGQLNMLQMKQNQMLTIEMAKGQVQLMKQVNQELVGTENVMDELQDTLQENAQQQQQVQQMSEMMNQFTDMAMGMMEEGENMDQELQMLAAEVQAEKESGLRAPAQPQVEAQVETQKKVVAANNMDDLI